MKSIARFTVAAVAIAIAVAQPDMGEAAQQVRGSWAPKSSAHRKLCSSPMTEDIIACGVEDQKAAERRMDEYFQKVRSRILPRHRQLLDDSQSKWSAYREAYCRFAGLALEGGDIQPWAVALCKARMANARADELNMQVKCEDGDLTCVPE